MKKKQWYCICTFALLMYEVELQMVPFCRGVVDEEMVKPVDLLLKPRPLPAGFKPLLQVSEIGVIDPEAPRLFWIDGSLQGERGGLDQR